MEQFSFRVHTGLMSQAREFVNFIDSLPRDILLTQTEISVKITGRPEHIVDDFLWVRLSMDIQRLSEYWRVKTFIHHKIMQVTAQVDASITHDICVILRAVGVEDL